MKPQLFKSLKHYKKEYLLKDIMSGLLVAIIALPLSIALGIQSGATLQQGILAAIVAGFFISALGGTKFQIGGPTAAFVVILVGYISDPKIGFIGLQIATVMAGVLLIILGLTKAGGLIKFIPLPIVVGFTTGIGITLLFGQLKDFFGLTVPSSHTFIEKVSGYILNISTLQVGALLTGIATLTMIVFIPKINKNLPSSFIAIAISTVAVALLQALTGNTLGIATIGSTYGEIKAEINFIDLSAIANVRFENLIVPTFVIAFLCAIESLLSATVADSMANSKSNPNQELVGQGVANIFSSLLGGLPATGAIARTAANINSGAKSPLAGVFHSVFLLLMYILLMPIAQYIPLTSLAAVLITVAIKMSNFPLFVRMLKFSVRDTSILIVTCLLTVFFDLTYGVIGGLVLTVVLMIPYLVKPVTVDCTEDSNHNVTVHTTGNVCFLNNGKLLNILKETDNKNHDIILDMSNMRKIDATTADQIAKTIRQVKEHGHNITVSNVHRQIDRRYSRLFNTCLETN